MWPGCSENLARFRPNYAAFEKTIIRRPARNILKIVSAQQRWYFEL